MDKQTLKSINNFALALEELVGTFEDKAQDEESFGGLGGVYSKQQDINNTIVSISEGIDNIKGSNKKILSNQEKIINLSKGAQESKDSGGLIPMGESGEGKRNKIKEGVGTIILIAGGVLAIGLAFKLIGDVDFASVIALSVSLPLIALAFIGTAVVIKEYGLETTDLINSGFALIIMAGALVLSSMVLNYIQPIGKSQFITAIGIGAVFVLLSYSISLALESFGDIKPQELLYLPLVFVAMSFAVMLSSMILNYIQPVEMSQFITAIGIGAVFVLLSYSISLALKPLKNIKPQELLYLPLVFVAMSFAVMLSSHILGMSATIGTGVLINLIFQSVVLSIMAIAMSIPMVVFKLLGLKNEDVLKGGLMLVIIAGTMMISSQLISMGDYSVFPSLQWALGAGLSLIAMSIPVVALGLLSMTGVGLAAIALGGIATMMVAGAIVLSSHILNKGDYGNFPDVGWSAGVGLSLVAFGGSMVLLGGIMLTGIGAIAISLGAGAVMTVANSIVDVSKVLSKGSFGNAGNLAKWALGVTLLFITFVPIFLLLGAVSMASSFASLLTFGTSPDPFVAGHNAIISVAETIKAVSFTLSGGKYSGGPDKDWAEGVSLAIGEFSSVFATLSSMNIASIFGGSSFSMEDYTKTIETVSEAILLSAYIFANAPSNWVNGPTEDWALGVGGAISAFAPVLKLGLDPGLARVTGGETMKRITGIIKATAHAIKDAGAIFSSDTTTDYSGGPTEKWVKGAGKSIEVFADTMVKADDWNWDKAEATEYLEVIKQIAHSIVSVATIMAPISNINVPGPNVTSNLAENIKSWSSVMENADGLETDGLIRTTVRIMFLAEGINKLANSISSLSSALGSLKSNQLTALTDITGAFISFSLIDESNFNSIMDMLDDKTDSLAEIFGGLKENESKEEKDDSFSLYDTITDWNPFSDDKEKSSDKEGEGGEKSATIDDLYNMLQSVDAKLGNISKDSKNLSDYATELRETPEVKVKA